MNGFRSVILKTCTILFGTFLSVSAFADDGGAWLSAQINKGWTNTYAFFRLEYRCFEQFSTTEAKFLAAGAGYKLTPWLKTDLSYEYWDVTPSVTIHKGVLTSTATMTRDGLSVSIREKLEYAYNTASSSSGLTLRSRLRAQYAIPDSAFRPYAMAETFNWSFWARSLYYAGTEIAFDKHNVLDVFYLYHLYPQAAGAKAEHVLGVGYYFNF